MSNWNEPPHAVYVVQRPPAELRTAALAGGATVFDLSIAGCTSPGDVTERINQAFDLDVTRGDFDAAFRLLVDPTEAPRSEGYLVVVTGCDEAAPDALAPLAHIAPIVSEHSRTGGPPYVWAFVAIDSRAVVIRETAAANDFLARAAASPDAINDSGAVPVVVS